MYADRIEISSNKRLRIMMQLRTNDMFYCLSKLNRKNAKGE